MFGIFLAAASAIGLYRLWGPRRFGHHRYAGGCGSRGGGRKSRGMRRLMSELKTTPEQEAAIRQSAEEIARAFREKSSWMGLEPATAALTAEAFDREGLLAQLREPGDDSLRVAIAAAIERLRAVLDPEQRRTLAAWMAKRCGADRGRFDV